MSLLDLDQQPSIINYAKKSSEEIQLNLRDWRLSFSCTKGFLFIFRKKLICHTDHSKMYLIHSTKYRISRNCNSLFGFSMKLCQKYWYKLFKDSKIFQTFHTSDRHCEEVSFQYYAIRMKHFVLSDSFISSFLYLLCRKNSKIKNYLEIMSPYQKWRILGY